MLSLFLWDRVGFVSPTTARQAAGDRQNAIVLMHSPGAVWGDGGGASNRERAASLDCLAVSALTVASSLSSKQAIVKSITKL